MGGLLWLAEALLLDANSHRALQAVLLLILIVATMAAYGLLLAALGATGWREVVNAVKRPADLRA
jgi:putative peptidoglycan lipid II flippase